MRWVYAVLSVFLITVDISAFAVSEKFTIQLNDKTRTVEAAVYAGVFKDPARVYKAEDFINNSPGFVPVNSIDSSYDQGARWYYFRLKNDSRIKNWVIDLKYPMIDHIEFYAYQNNRLVKFLKTGDAEPVSTREIKDRHFIMQLDFEYDESRPNKKFFDPPVPLDILIKLDTSSAYKFPLKIEQASVYTEKKVFTQFFFGLYYGLMLAFVLYHTFVYMQRQDKVILDYILVILTFSIAEAAFQGFGALYLWPFWQGASAQIARLMLIISLYYSVKFFSDLFLSRNKERKLYRYMFYLRIVQIIGIYTMLLFDSYLSTVMMAVISLLSMTSLLISGVYLVIKKVALASYYLFSWSIFIMGGFVLLLAIFDYLPMNFLTSNSVQVGSVILAMTLALAQGERSRRLQEEKDQANELLYEQMREKQQLQKQLNLTLEDKVTQKTNQLMARQNELNDQMRLAALIQSSQLPQLQATSLNQTAFFYSPAEQIGGDMIDIYQNSTDETTLFICDVSGHGVASALLSSMIKAVFTSLRDQKGYKPSEILNIIRHQIREALNDNFVTAVICKIDHKKMTAVFASAGHPASFIISKGLIREVKPPGRMIADFCETSCEDELIQFDNSARIILYTDGLLEAINMNSVEYGSARFKKKLIESEKMTPTQAAEYVRDDVLSYRKSMKAESDDMAFIVYDIKKEI